MEIKNVDAKLADQAVKLGGIKVVPVQNGVDLARRMVEKGRFGRLPMEIKGCLDYNKLAEHLLRSGFYETSLGVVFIDDRFLEKLK